MTIISMMIDDCPLEMIYDSLFGSRDEQGIIPRVKEESVRNGSLQRPLTVGVLCPADFPFKSHIG